jgi:hypothetical protein
MTLHEIISLVDGLRMGVIAGADLNEHIYEQNAAIDRVISKLEDAAINDRHEAKLFWMKYFKASELDADCNEMTIACMEEYAQSKNYSN